jgi:hypothetical protein
MLTNMFFMLSLNTMHLFNKLASLVKFVINKAQYVIT